MTRYPAFYALLVFTGGVLLGSEFHLADFVSFCAVGLLLTLAIIFLLVKQKRIALVLIACVLFVLGFFRINLVSHNLPSNHISHFNDIGHECLVYGNLDREPDIRPDKTYLTVACDSITLSGQTIRASGSMLVRIDRLDDRFNYADRVVVLGLIRAPMEKRNFHGFNYREFLSLRRIHSYMTVKGGGSVRIIGQGTGNPFVSKVVIPLREYILSVFDRYLSGDERHLIAGYLIGETRFISPEVYQHFRDTGTLHLLAVSGSNVALVIATVTILFKLLGAPRRFIYLIALITIVVFCQLSFNQPSVVRASVMIGLVIIGRMIFRKANLLNIIAVAALAILLFDPLMIYDVGFQLSFAAAFALIYFLKGLVPRKRRGRSPIGVMMYYFLMILLSSVVVQFVVGPILAWNFGTIPLITFASNLVVIPLSSFAVISSLLLVIFAPIPYLSSLIATIANIFLRLSILSVDWFASMPLVKLDLASPGLLHVVFYYVVLFLLFSTLKDKRRFSLLVAAVLVWVNFAVWQMVVRNAEDESSVTFLDVGSNSCIHIQDPSGFDAVITDLNAGNGFDYIEHTIKPHLSGEGVGKLSFLATRCDSAYSDIETDIAISCGHDDSHPLDNQSDSVYSLIDNRLKLYIDDGTTKAFVYEQDRFRILWIKDWISLTMPELSLGHPVDIVAVPFPDKLTADYLPLIYQLSPRTVVVHNYSSRWKKTDIGIFKNELRSNGINVFDTQTYGAVRCCFNKKDIEIETAVHE